MMPLRQRGTSIMAQNSNDATRWYTVTIQQEITVRTRGDAELARELAATHPPHLNCFGLNGEGVYILKTTSHIKVIEVKEER